MGRTNIIDLRLNWLFLILPYFFTIVPVSGSTLTHPLYSLSFYVLLVVATYSLYISNFAGSAYTRTFLEEVIIRYILIVISFAHLFLLFFMTLDIGYPVQQVIPYYALVAAIVGCLTAVYLLRILYQFLFRSGKWIEFKISICVAFLLALIDFLHDVSGSGLLHYASLEALKSVISQAYLYSGSYLSILGLVGALHIQVVNSALDSFNVFASDTHLWFLSVLLRALDIGLCCFILYAVLRIPRHISYLFRKEKKAIRPAPKF